MEINREKQNCMNQKILSKERRERILGKSWTKSAAQKSLATRSEVYEKGNLPFHLLIR